jgi:hypothetical protein
MLKLIKDSGTSKLKMPRVALKQEFVNPRRKIKHSINGRELF